MTSKAATVNIPAAELSFTFSRAPGPGGQNVNKLNTRATLLFNLRESPSLSHTEKELIEKRLASRINNNGIMRVVSFRHRTQKANRDAAVARFFVLLQEALHQDKPRKKTRTPRAAKERRLTAKKHRSRLKQARGKKINPRE